MSRKILILGLVLFLPVPGFAGRCPDNAKRVAGVTAPISEWKVFPGLKILKIRDEEIILSREQTKILEYLLAYPGKAMEFKEISDKCGLDSDSVAVIGYLKRLQKKLGPNGGVIEHYHGFGYRLREPVEVRDKRRADSIASKDGKVIQKENVIVDDYAKTVTINGRDYYLSLSSFELLRFLARYPDEVIPYSALEKEFSEVYDKPKFKIQQMLFEMRDSIANEQDNPVQVVRGIGYRFRK